MILLGVCTVYINVSFGVNVNTYASFFKVDPETLDTLTTVGVIIGAFIATPLFALASYSDVIRVKLSITLATFIKSAGMLLIVTSAFNKEWFLMTAVGRIIEEVATIAMLTLFASFAPLWFPKNQVGIAVGLGSLCTSLGAFIGLMLPIKVNDNFALQELGMLSNCSNSCMLSVKSDVDDDISFNMKVMYSPVLFIYLASFLTFLVYLTDLPPKPPSLEQAKKRAMFKEIVSFRLSLSNFWKDTKVLFLDRIFIIDCLLVAMTTFALMCEIIMLSWVLKTMVEVTDPLTLASNLLVINATARVVGACLAGKVMAHIKFQRLHVILSCFVSFTFSSIILIGYENQTVWVLIVGHVGYGLAASFALMILYEFVTQHHYPCDEHCVSYWKTLFHCTFGVVIPKFGRIIYVYTNGGHSILVYQLVILFVPFVLSLVSSNKRKVAEVSPLLRPDAPLGKITLVTNYGSCSSSNVNISVKNSMTTPSERTYSV